MISPTLSSLTELAINVTDIMVLVPHTNTQPKLSLKPGRWTVGSAATCSYRIVAPGVQSRHALIICGPRSIVLKAWDSRTWCNDSQVVGEIKLKVGDRLKLGSAEFQIDAAVDESPLEQINELHEHIQALRDESSMPVGDRSAESLNDSLTIAPSAESERSVGDVVETTEFSSPIQDSSVETEQHLAELTLLTEQLRLALYSAGEEAADLRGELSHLRDSAAQRERHWSEQVATWTAEREQFQAERAGLRGAQQELRDELDRQLLEYQTQLDHWRSECDRIEAESQQQHTEWAAEHTRLLEEALRAEDRLAEAVTSLALSPTDSSPPVEESHAEREQLTQLADELRVQQEQLTRDLAELNSAQANLTRDKQVLDHSWNWVQTERRKLAQDKEQGEQLHNELNAERQRIEAEREQWERDRTEFAETRKHWSDQQLAYEEFQAEKIRWEEERRQTEDELQDVAEKLEATRTTLETQLQSLAEVAIHKAVEEVELESLRSELFSHETQLEVDNPVVENRTPDAIQDAEPTLATWLESEKSVEGLTTRLEDAWSIGVDLTDTFRISEAASQKSLPILSTVEWTPTVSLTLNGSKNDETDTGLNLVSPPFLHSQTASGQPLNAVTSLAQLTAIEKSLTTSSGPHAIKVASLCDFVVQESRLSNPHCITTNLLASECDIPKATINKPTCEVTSAAKLRSELAEMFNMPELNTSVLEPSSPPNDSWTASEATEESQVSDLSEPRVELDQPPAPAVEAPVLASPIETKEVLNFAEDEHVDDSVSRYMQHLLSRSRQHSEQFATTKTTQKSHATNTVTPPEKEIASEKPSREQDPSVDRGSSGHVATATELSATTPAHAQDKEAVRLATETMRQHANQQTRKNVETSNWKRIKSSIKTKSSLAAFSFVLSIGLLYLGTIGKPEFIVLGGCAACIGVLTWIDLFMAIRETRALSAQLGNKQPPPK